LVLRLRIGAPPFAAPAFGAEAVAGDHDLMRVMGESVKRRRREQRTLKQIRPLGEGAVRGDDERAAFVALIDHFVEVLWAGGGERFEAKVIEDQDVRSRVGEQSPLVCPIGAAAVQMAEHAGGRGKDDVEAAPTGFVAEGLRQVRLADAGRPLNEHGLVPLDESTRRQIENLLPIDPAVKPTIETLYRFTQLDTFP